MAGRGVSDADVLTPATSKGCAVLNRNRKHIIPLHRQRMEHPGIVACTSDPDFAVQARRIHLALGTADEPSRQLIRANRPGPNAPQGQEEATSS